MIRICLEKTVEPVANAVSNPTVAPRVAFKDLTNTLMSSLTSPGVGILPKPITFANQVQVKRKLELGSPGR